MYENYDCAKIKNMLNVVNTYYDAVHQYVCFSLLLKYMMIKTQFHVVFTLRKYLIKLMLIDNTMAAASNNGCSAESEEAETCFIGHLE